MNRGSKAVSRRPFKLADLFEDKVCRACFVLTFFENVLKECEWAVRDLLDRQLRWEEDGNPTLPFLLTFVVTQERADDAVLPRCDLQSYLIMELKKRRWGTPANTEDKAHAIVDDWFERGLVRTVVVPCPLLPQPTVLLQYEKGDDKAVVFYPGDRSGENKALRMPHRYVTYYRTFLDRAINRQVG